MPGTEGARSALAALCAHELSRWLVSSGFPLQQIQRDTPHRTPTPSEASEVSSRELRGHAPCRSRNNQSRYSGHLNGTFFSLRLCRTCSRIRRSSLAASSVDFDSSISYAKDRSRPKRRIVSTKPFSVRRIRISFSNRFRRLI